VIKRKMTGSLAASFFVALSLINASIYRSDQQKKIAPGKPGAVFFLLSG
jgi:hypothetical protein